jgi:hypothetical protein
VFWVKKPTCINVADEAAAATFVAGMDDSAGGVDVFQGFFGSTGVAVVDGDTGGFSKLSCRLTLMAQNFFYSSSLTGGKKDMFHRGEFFRATLKFASKDRTHPMPPSALCITRQYKTTFQ